MKPLSIGALLFALALPLSTPAAAPEQVADGIIIPIGDKFLKIQVCADNIIRVAEAGDRAFFSRASLSVEPQRKPPAG